MAAAYKALKKGTKIAENEDQLAGLCFPQVLLSVITVCYYWSGQCTTECGLNKNTVYSEMILRRTYRNPSKMCFFFLLRWQTLEILAANMQQYPINVIYLFVYLNTSQNDKLTMATPFI